MPSEDDPPTPVNFLFLKKMNRKERVKFEVWKETDIFVFNYNEDGKNIIEENICEINQDDDVDTDDEVLCSGI